MTQLFNEETEDEGFPGEGTTETSSGSSDDGIYNSSPTVSSPPTSPSTPPVSGAQNPTFHGNSVFTGGWLRSGNFVTGATGWSIDANGNVEFANGYFRGDITGASGTFSGSISASSGFIGGFTIMATALYAGTGATRIQLDTTSGIHLGATLFADAPFSVSLAGALKAESGTIANWAISTTALSTGTFDTAGKMYFGTSGLSLSDTFKVTAAGALTATSATITGTITATSGAIGGWVVDATSIKDAAGVVGMSSAVTGGDDIRFWAGDSTPANAEFSVTEAGVIKESSGTIGGCALAATSIGSTTFVSGPLGSGWNISNTGTAEFQNISVRGIIKTSVFEKDTISCVNGLVLVSSADTLNADMTALDASTLTISGNTTFSANEVIRIKDGTDDEWMLVTNAGSAPVARIRFRRRHRRRTWLRTSVAPAC